MSPLTLTMYDSVTVTEIPAHAKAVAGYVGGKWPTYPVLVRTFPNAHKLSIAISASEDADCLDVEKGDATNAQAAEWVKRQHARGLRHPKVYTSISNWPSLDATLDAAGLVRHRPYHHVLFWVRTYKRWSAHYTGKAHRCDKSCGFPIRGKVAGTQWTNKALGRNLDASLVGRRFFA